MSEPIIGKVEFGNQSFSDAMKSKPAFWEGIQLEKVVEPKAEGLSEDNAVKVWLALREEFAGVFSSPADDDWPKGTKGDLYKLLTERLVATEKQWAPRGFKVIPNE